MVRVEMYRMQNTVIGPLKLSKNFQCWKAHEKIDILGEWTISYLRFKFCTLFSGFIVRRRNFKNKVYPTFYKNLHLCLTIRSLSVATAQKLLLFNRFSAGSGEKLRTDQEISCEAVINFHNFIFGSGSGQVDNSLFQDKSLKINNSKCSISQSSFVYTDCPSLEVTGSESHTLDFRSRHLGWRIYVCSLEGQSRYGHRSAAAIIDTIERLCPDVLYLGIGLLDYRQMLLPGSSACCHSFSFNPGNADGPLTSRRSSSSFSRSDLLFSGRIDMLERSVGKGVPNGVYIPVVQKALLSRIPHFPLGRDRVSELAAIGACLLPKPKEVLLLYYYFLLYRYAKIYRENKRNIYDRNAEHKSILMNHGNEEEIKEEIEWLRNKVPNFYEAFIIQNAEILVANVIEHLLYTDFFSTKEMVNQNSNKFTSYRQCWSWLRNPLKLENDWNDEIKQKDRIISGTFKQQGDRKNGGRLYDWPTTGFIRSSAGATLHKQRLEAAKLLTRSGTIGSCRSKHVSDEIKKVLIVCDSMAVEETVTILRRTLESIIDQNISKYPTGFHVQMDHGCNYSNYQDKRQFMEENLQGFHNVIVLSPQKCFEKLQKLKGANSFVTSSVISDFRKFDGWKFSLVVWLYLVIPLVWSIRLLYRLLKYLWTNLITREKHISVGSDQLVQHLVDSYEHRIGEKSQDCEIEPNFIDSKITNTNSQNIKCSVSQNVAHTTPTHHSDRLKNGKFKIIKSMFFEWYRNNERD